MKKLLAIVTLALVACGGAAGVQIVDEQPFIIPRETSQIASDSGMVTSMAIAPVVTPDAFVDEPDGSTPIGDASDDTLSEASEDASLDASFADADAGVIIPPPLCQVRGSCVISPAVCMEYEADGAQLVKEKAKCVGAYVWSDAPCNRATSVGSCKAALPYDIACPKYEVVYIPPATSVTAKGACDNIPGVFIP